MLGQLPATFGFFGFFLFFSDFFCLNPFIFEPKVEKNKYGCFFHTIWATDLKFGTKNNVRTRQSTKLWFLLNTENHKWFKVVSIKISFDSWAKSLLFRTHHLWNSTTKLILICTSSYLPTTTPTAVSAIVIVAWFDFSSWKGRSIKSSHYHAEIRTRAKF